MSVSLSKQSLAVISPGKAMIKGLVGIHVSHVKSLLLVITGL